ncbi:MAG: hypothetical protein IPL39_22720 [Opitutaceae bacterium]|nr:hypothetical protein [Opitutaceae bacterium]
MNYLRWLLLPLFAVLPLLALGAQPSAEEVIAKARSYVGKERDLDGIRSLHYRGRLEVRDAAGALVDSASGTIEMFLQRPGQQKIVSVVGPLRDTMGLDEFTGWQRVEQLAQPAQGRTTILPLAQLRRTQASAFENLSFFRGIEKRGGRIELRGETTVDGRAALAVAFIHPGNIVYLRSFDKETGRLLLTEGEGGEQMREEGEVVVAGIRFPRRLTSTRRNAEGHAYSVTLFFDEVRVNEVFPADTFAVPMVVSR